MHLRSTVRVGLALVALTAFSSALPAMAAPAKTTPKTAPKATAKAPKAAPKPTTKPVKASAVGKTPSETVQKLIGAMRRRDRSGISSAFNWPRFAKEMNSLMPGDNGLTPDVYQKLLVETLDVEPAVSSALSVGKETKKGSDVATVEMRRAYASGSGSTKQVRVANIMTLLKEKSGWRIIKLDSGQPAMAPAPAPVPRAPQGMVPAAGADSKDKK